jgi:hypothetical protein
MIIKKTKNSSIDLADPLSYKTIKNTIYDWRHSGTRHSTWNNLDTPGHLFFKVVFHFFNGDNLSAEPKSIQSGLLAPTWVASDDEGALSEKLGKSADTIMSQQTGSNPIEGLVPGDTTANSAYNFLLRNDELERAEKLKLFITLLSSISTYSPWYFQEIEGLGEVLSRPFKTGESYKLDEQPKSITIKCLPDSEDNRIATLLDLYRDAAFSHTWHREILPANLRRFDMSIYIFSSPIANLHSGTSILDSDKRSTDASSTTFVPSYKRIELHDCEINYNAVKDGYSGMNNADGFQQTFSIPITIGDAYEHRYNMFLDRTIGDIVAIDLIRNSYSVESERGKIDKIFVDAAQETSQQVMSALKERVEYYQNSSIDIARLVDDITGNVVSQTIKSQLLGNIYKTSISDLTTNISQMSKNLKSGNLGGVINNAKGVAEIKNGWYAKKIGESNIFNR